MVQRVGAQAVISDVSNFVAKFNNGQVDMVGAPAYAYKPLEIYKGLGTNGAMFNFPVLQVTADFVIRPDQFRRLWTKIARLVCEKPTEKHRDDWSFRSRHSCKIQNESHSRRQNQISKNVA
jgi:hypothetical protein